MNSIKRNAAKCLKCGDVVESKFTHDFQPCSCGAIFVDGGLSYCRIGYEDRTLIEVLTKYHTCVACDNESIEYLLPEGYIHGQWMCVECNEPRTSGGALLPDPED